jgi:hypothetical protein
MIEPSATIIQNTDSPPATKPLTPDEFARDVLGCVKTPFGHLQLQWKESLEAVFNSAVESMRRCRAHKPDRCVCWLAARDRFHEILGRFGERSPEGSAALAMWRKLELLGAQPQTEWSVLTL